MFNMSDFMQTSKEEKLRFEQDRVVSVASIINDESDEIFEFLPIINKLLANIEQFVDNSNGKDLMACPVKILPVRLIYRLSAKLINMVE